MAPDRLLQPLYFESLDFWMKPAAKSAHAIAVACFQCALVAFPFQLLRHYIAIEINWKWIYKYTHGYYCFQFFNFECVLLIIYLCRICGQSNPTYFFFVFWNDVHRHQNIQCIINTTPYIFLIIIWRVQRLTIRFLNS